MECGFTAQQLLRSQKSLIFLAPINPRAKPELRISRENSINCTTGRPPPLRAKQVNCRVGSFRVITKARRVATPCQPISKDTQSAFLSNYFYSGIRAVTRRQRRHAGLRDVSHPEGLLPLQHRPRNQKRLPSYHHSLGFDLPTASPAAAQVHDSLRRRQIVLQNLVMRNHGWVGSGHSLRIYQLCPKQLQLFLPEPPLPHKAQMLIETKTGAPESTK